MSSMHVYVCGVCVCILPQCDSHFIAVTMFAKSFLQISQMDISLHRFKMKGLPRVIKVEAVNLYLWQQRRFSRLLQG